MTLGRSLLTLACFAFLASFAAYADDGGTPNDPNAVSVELLGRGLLYSINFDRQLDQNFALGLGFSTFGVSASDTSGNTGSTHLTLIPLYFNYYFWNSGSHHAYGTIGADFVNGTGNYDGIDWSGTTMLFVPGVGYEYRGDSGFLFRGTIYYLAGSGLSQGWFGVSFGYAF